MTVNTIPRQTNVLMITKGGTMKKESDAMARARAKYDTANTVRYSLKFNRNTDADIIDRLESLPPAEGGRGGVQAYIKQLIREDVRNGD